MRRETNKSRVRKLEAAGGVCCFIAGILAALLGSLLTASGWITGVEMHPWIHRAGTGLLILTIPLVLFAGFCLDWAEHNSNKASDNDRHQTQGTTSPDRVMISKEVKRGVEEAGVKQNRKPVSLDQSLKTHGQHSGGNNSEGMKSVRRLVGNK